MPKYLVITDQTIGNKKPPTRQPSISFGLIEVPEGTEVLGLPRIDTTKDMAAAVLNLFEKYVKEKK